MRLPRVLAAAVVAAILAGAGCGSGGATDRPPNAVEGRPTSTTVDAPTSAPPTDSVYGGIEQHYVGQGPKVVILGDSIMVATKARLREDLKGYALKVAALTGEGLAGGPMSQTLGTGSMPEIASDYADDPPEILVIELGTNDAWLVPLTIEEAGNALGQIVSQFPDACKVVVSISERSTTAGYDREEAGELNLKLAQVADRLVDWGERSTQDPDLLEPDGIHPTDDGQAVLARSIGDAVRSCER